jgi:cupin fold WbuC family metalloprotein
MKIINSKLLDNLSAQAKENPRRRQNLNLHQSYDDPLQRLLNAMEPASYIRPHRHLRDPKPESFIGLRGRLALLIFADDGQVEEVIPFGPREDALGVDLPAGVWHSVVCLEEGSNIKGGLAPFNEAKRCQSLFLLPFIAITLYVIPSLR